MMDGAARPRARAPLALGAAAPRRCAWCETPANAGVNKSNQDKSSHIKSSQVILT